MIALTTVRCLHVVNDYVSFFFFQAEDGIRDVAVTGVQTCALPIYLAARVAELEETAPLFRAQPQLEHVDALDHRRDDVPVAPPAHLFEERLLRFAQHLRLIGQQVTETRHATQLRGDRGRGARVGEGTSGPGPLSSI